MSETTYKDAGVDIDAGIEAVERIKGHAQKTFRKEVMSGLGGFGSLFALDINKYKKPILVSGTDGVGTKLKVAIDMNVHETVGIDLVAMCVNDILVQGAEPLFFLDYLATGKLMPEQIEDIVSGVADGCEQAKCSLIGGETAEMPGMYNAGDYDAAGFVVGVVDEENLIDGTDIEEGNIVIGLASSGLHSNGFSLVRHLLFEKNDYHLSAFVPELDEVLGEELIKPTKIYVNLIQRMLEEVSIKGMAHITGGGLLDNIPRILPEGLQAEINLDAWEVPPIFNLLKKLGNLPNSEIYRTFNMGIGFVLIVDKKDKESILNIARELDEEAYVLGSISNGNQGVVLIGDE